MLGKLMKHELRATSRIMLPLFAVVLVFTLGMSVVIRTAESVTNKILGLFYGLIGTGYGIALAAVMIGVVVLMVKRFRDNYLQDEGYVMLTLPVSSHQLIWSKALVSSIWFVLAGLLICLSAVIIGFVASYDTEFMTHLIKGWNLFLEQMKTYGINGPIVCLEMIILTLASLLGGCMMFYSALAIGHSFDRRKMLISVLVYVGMSFALSFITGSIMTMVDLNAFLDTLVASGTMAAMHAFFWINTAIVVVVGAVGYFLTNYFLKNRLNIE